jgi:hypothetical protein
MTSPAADAVQKQTVYLPEFPKCLRLFQPTKISAGFGVSIQYLESTFVFSCFFKLPKICRLVIEGHVCT